MIFADVGSSQTQLLIAEVHRAETDARDAQSRLTELNEY